MEKGKNDGTNRRDFLKLGVAAPAAAVVAASGTEVAAAEAVDLSSNKMQDTAHTRAYFESARF